ncbi:hypothetical protein LQW54_008334 [Pestalotiopsis sp. IQ-011]
MAAPAPKEDFSQADAFPESDFFYGDDNFQERTCEERAALFLNLLQKPSRSVGRYESHVSSLDFNKFPEPSVPEAACSDHWPRSVAEAQFPKNVTTHREYYSRVFFRHLPRRHLDTNAVLSALQQIARGSPSQDSRVWARVEQRLVRCIVRASKIQWSADRTFYAHFPEQEDLEALRIYGSADQGFGHLPKEMDTLLRKAGLYFLVVSPEKRTVPVFWKKNIVRLGWKEGVDYCQIQGDEPPSPHSDENSGQTGSTENPSNAFETRTGTDLWERLSELKNELQDERQLILWGKTGTRAEWCKQMTQEIDSLIDSLVKMICQERQAATRAKEALRLVKEIPSEPDNSVDIPRKRQRDDPESRERDAAARAKEALRLVKAISWKPEDYLSGPKKRETEDTESRDQLSPEANRGGRHQKRSRTENSNKNGEGEVNDESD